MSSRQLFRGIIAYVEIKEGNHNGSESYIQLISTFGGKVCADLSPNITHYIWSNGSKLRLKKAKTIRKLKVVNPQWVIRSIKNKKIMVEEDYPPMILEGNLKTNANRTRSPIRARSVSDVCNSPSFRLLRSPIRKYNNRIDNMRVINMLSPIQESKLGKSVNYEECKIQHNNWRKCNPRSPKEEKRSTHRMMNRSLNRGELKKALKISDEGKREIGNMADKECTNEVINVENTLNEQPSEEQIMDEILNFPLYPEIDIKPTNTDQNIPYLQGEQNRSISDLTQNGLSFPYNPILEISDSFIDSFSIHDLVDCVQKYNIGTLFSTLQDELYYFSKQFKQYCIYSPPYIEGTLGNIYSKQQIDAIDIIIVHNPVNIYSPILIYAFLKGKTILSEDFLYECMQENKFIPPKNHKSRIIPPFLSKSKVKRALKSKFVYFELREFLPYLREIINLLGGRITETSKEGLKRANLAITSYILVLKYRNEQVTSKKRADCQLLTFQEFCDKFILNNED